MQKIIDGFKKIGANAVINLYKPGVSLRNGRGFRISIREDRKKHASCFVLEVQDGTQIYVQDVSAKDHALLLKVSWANERGRYIYEDFLCGREDHGWYVTALGYTCNSLEEAFESLRPEEIRNALQIENVPRSKWNKRRNKAFLRQGEWFFIPMPADFDPPGNVRRKEGLGASRKPHIADFVCSEGVARYTHTRYRGTLTAEQVAQLQKQGVTGFRQVFVVQAAYAKGRVVHPDHKTVFLDGWHRVVPNTENRLPNSSAFID